MYKIVFHYTANCTETYGGGTYIYQGEKYAILNDLQPKLYKSKGMAERSAKQIFQSCSNVGYEYEIVEV